MSVSPKSAVWIALSIGNTHYRWGYGIGHQITQTWTTPHPTQTDLDSSWAAWQAQSPALAAYAQQHSHPFPPLWLASVVPTQASRWQAYPALHPITLADIPLGQLYPSLGLDRALALWAAGMQHGWPVLVIDAGTALTFSGADAHAQFDGGAILPGLGLQLHSLAAATALPFTPRPLQPPERWASNTPTAIQSGVWYGIVATLINFINAWLGRHPNSALVITGGDAQVLISELQFQMAQPLSPWKHPLIWEPQLILQGIVLARQAMLSAAQ